MLSRLESQREALVFGHAVPMPVVVRTREYGSPRSYDELARPIGSTSDGPGRHRSLEEELTDLF